MQFKAVIFILAVLCLGAVVQAEELYTQKYLSPFYRPATTAGVNYTYSSNIVLSNPLDVITTAIISFDVFFTPTVKFTLWVNNLSCNTLDYTISTTYSGSAQGRLRFDCSNLITHAGTYSIKMVATKNTGAIVGWVDVAYISVPPPPSPKVSGTEYQVGDMMTAFVQLKDSQGLPVSNGSCFLDVYYPFNGTVHPYTIQDAPMINARKDDGLYYYDMFAPDIIGVYMLSAKCSYSLSEVWIYPDEEIILGSTRQSNSGTWSGSTVSLNSPQDSLYDYCIPASSSCSANYTFNLSTYGALSNVTSVGLYWSGQVNNASISLYFAYLNRSGLFVTLPNGASLVSVPDVPNGIDTFQSNSIPISDIVFNNTLKIRVSTIAPFGSVFKLYNNWLSLSIQSSVGIVQDVKGSGEFHVTNRITNQSVSSILLNCLMYGNCSGWWINSSLQGISDQNQLNYQVLQALVNNQTLLQQYVLQVLNNQTYWLPNLNVSLTYLTNNITYHFPLLEQEHQNILNNMSAYQNALLGSLGQIPMLVWNYSSKNLSYVDWETGALFVWNSTGNNRTLTYYNQSYAESIAGCLNTGICSGWWVNEHFVNITDYVLSVYDVVLIINGTESYWFANLSTEEEMTQMQLQFLQSTVEAGFSNMPNITGYQLMLNLLYSMNDTLQSISYNESIYFPLFDGLLVNITGSQQYYYPLFNALLYNILSYEANETPVNMTGFAEALVDIMQNQSYYYPLFAGNFSNLTANEMLIISLLYSLMGAGNATPVVQGCTIDNTAPVCNDIVRFSCNITSAGIIAGVVYSIGGVNYAPTANGSIYYLDLNFSGMYQVPQVYSWSDVIVTDSYADDFAFPLGLSATYTCVNTDNQLYCWHNAEPFLKNRILSADNTNIEWLCYLNRSEAECVSEVYDANGSLLQTNPEPITIEGMGMVSTYRVNPTIYPEHYFQAWFTKDNLEPSIAYNFSVTCNDGYTILQYSDIVVPQYKSMAGIAYRGVWVKENMVAILGGIIGLTFIIGAGIYLVRLFRR